MPLTRSEIMSRITGDDLRPERLLSEACLRLELLHERNRRDLPGSPDLVFPWAGLAVFVHGCFWHGCPLHYREPRTRRGFWAAKVASNRRRDSRSCRRLRRLGWSTMTVWEHAVKPAPDAAAGRVLRRIREIVDSRRPKSYVL